MCLLAEVEEQISESRACVHGASNKLEESKEFEAASNERQKEAQLSEATRRKLQRRSQIINAEVKSELAKAVAQLRHSSHHYRHVKGEIERALRQRDRRVMDYARAQGRAEALADEVEQTRELMKQLQNHKEDAEVRARRLQEECDQHSKARTLAETQAKTLSATLEQEEEALRRTQAECDSQTAAGSSLAEQLQQCQRMLDQSESTNKQLTKSRDLLVAQLKNSKEVVARITADNLMFLNKVVPISFDPASLGFASLGVPAALRRRRPRPPSSGGAQPGAGLSVAPCLGLKRARLGLRSHALCATRAEGAGEGECDALCDDDYEFKPSSLRDGPEQPSLKRLRSYLSFLSTDASALSSGTASCACPRLDLATDTAQSRGRSSTVRQSWSRR